MDIKKHISELKRRNVIKVAIAYLIVAWLITQVASIVLPTFDAPPYFMKMILFILVIGFPLNIVFAWVYEITPEGIKKTKDVDQETSIAPRTNQRLNKVIIVSLSIAVVLLLIIQFSGNTESRLVSDEIVDTTQISLAVLAFEDISPQNDQEYFSDGMSTELTSLLSTMKDLNVRDRRSSFSFKGENATISTIATELNVTHIIDGSVRKSGDNVRIDIQLIDATDGSSIWTQTFNREMVDIFKMQNDIASIVRDHLKLKLLTNNRESSKVNPEAYSLYLQADFIFFKFNPETILDAIDLLMASIAIDSSYAPTYSLLSRVTNVASINYQLIPPKEGLQKARELAEKAIFLDPYLASAYSSLASTQLHTRDFDGTNANINKALEINSNNAHAVAVSSIIKAYAGDIDGAMKSLRKVLEISPKEYRYYRNLGFGYFWKGDLDEALKYLEKYNYYYPSGGISHNIMSRIYFEKGEYENALSAAEKEPSKVHKYSAKCTALYGLKRFEESDLFLEKLIATSDENAKASIAEVYMYRDDIENAFKYLDMSYNISDIDLIEVINYPVFKKVYNDPRWKELLLKMNLPKSHWLLKHIQNKN